MQPALLSTSLDRSAVARAGTDCKVASSSLSAASLADSLLDLSASSTSSSRLKRSLKWSVGSTESSRRN